MPTIRPTTAAPARTTGTLSGESVAMGEVSGSTTALPPTVDGAPQFVFTHHHPTGWQVAAGKILPRLKQRPLEWGVNNVDMRQGEDGKMRFDLTHFRAWLYERQETLIPYEVDAPAHASYVLRHRTEPGKADVYVDRWTTCYPGSPRLTRDDAGWHEWLGSLVDRGLIAPPDRLALENLAEQIERQIEGTHSTDTMRGGERPDTAARRKTLAADLAVVKKAIGKMTGGKAAAQAAPVTALDAGEAYDAI